MDGDGRAELVVTSLQLGADFEVNEGTPAGDTVRVFKRVMSAPPP